MVTCAFLGQFFLLDNAAELEKKIFSALEKLIQLDDNFVFYFSKNTDYEQLCKKVTDKMKYLFPQKSIVTTLVMFEEDKEENHSEFNNTFDEIIYPLPPSNVYFTFKGRQLDKWKIFNSMYLVMYYYELMIDIKNNNLVIAKKQEEKNALKILDIFSFETLEKINMKFDLLCDQSKSVLMGLKSGKTYNEIGLELGISSGRVHQLATYGRRKIRQGLK